MEIKRKNNKNQTKEKETKILLDLEHAYDDMSVDEYLAMLGQTREEFANEDEIAETMYSLIEALKFDDWQDFLGCCRCMHGKCLVTGYFMSWMGPQEGGCVYDSLEEAVRRTVMDDSSPVFSVNSDEGFMLDETHHDTPVNGNHYVFSILTKAGEIWYENHMYLDRKTICEKLKNTEGYTEKIDKDFFLSVHWDWDC